MAKFVPEKMKGFLCLGGIAAQEVEKEKAMTSREIRPEIDNGQNETFCLIKTNSE